MKSLALCLVVCASSLGCSQSSSVVGPDSAEASSASPAAIGVPEVASGVGIGPVRVGMTIEQLRTLGLPLSAGALPNEEKIGPYIASFDGDRVAAVYVEMHELPSGLRIGDSVVFASDSTLSSLAAKFSSCGSVQHNIGANVIVCDAGRSVLVAGGPTGVLSIHVNGQERADRVYKSDRECGSLGSLSTWKHPSFNLRFSYPDSMLTVVQKPDGASLFTAAIGKCEDRSDQGGVRPCQFRVAVSVRQGQMLHLMSSSGLRVSEMFPGGTVDTFRETKDFAERSLVGPRPGFRFAMGSHEAHRDYVYAPLPADRTLEIVCDYVGEMARPKIPLAQQKEACDRVVRSISIDG